MYSPFVPALRTLIAASTTLFISAVASTQTQNVTYPVGQTAAATGYMQAIATNAPVQVNYFTPPAAITASGQYSFTTSSQVEAIGAPLSIFGSIKDPLCTGTAQAIATGIPGSPFLPGASTEVAMNANGNQLVMAILNDAYNIIDIQRTGNTNSGPTVKMSAFSENADDDVRPPERGNRFRVPFDVAASTTMTIDSAMTRNDTVANGTLTGVSDLRVNVYQVISGQLVEPPLATTNNLQITAPVAPLTQQSVTLNSQTLSLTLAPGSYAVEVFFRAGAKLDVESSTCRNLLAQSITDHLGFVNVTFQ